jgi:hypothetical protein
MSVPSGQYVLKITKCSYREGRIQPMLNFRCQVDEGPHAGSLLAFNYNFGPYGMVLIRALVCACDIPHIYHDSIEFSAFEGKRFVAAVNYGRMGLPPSMPFIRPALLSERALKEEFKKIRKAWQGGDARVKEVDAPLLTYNPADNVVPRYDIVILHDGSHKPRMHEPFDLPINPDDIKPWKPEGQRGGRFRSDRPNKANGPRHLPETAAVVQSDPAYCQCASPQPKHVKFDTFEYDKCEGCGKEIKP